VQTSVTDQIVGKRSESSRGVYIYDLAGISWVAAGKPGLAIKPVRRDDEKGEFLGLLSFEPMTSSGLHQHLDVAISYFLSGGLTDYSGEARAGQAGINFNGSTHDAISYHASLLIARLEGPVIYEGEATHRLHAGARGGWLVNEYPERAPDLNITVRDLASTATSVAGVSRRVVFDYANTPHNRRFVELSLLPGTTIPMHRLSKNIDWFVIAGDISINEHTACANHCVVIEAGSEVTVNSRFGALILAWADGPIHWVDREASDLYGFHAVYC
jgi:hypothetical protein